MLLFKISDAERLGRALSNAMILYVVLIIILILIPPIILIILEVRKGKRILKRHKLNTIKGNNPNNWFKDHFDAIDLESLRRIEKAKLKNKIVLSISITSFISLVIIGIISSINSDFGIVGTSVFSVILIIMIIISFYLKINFEKEYKKVFFEIYTPRLLDLINNNIKTNSVFNTNDIINIVNVSKSSSSNSYNESKDDYNNALFYTKKHLFYKSQELINIIYNNNDIKLRSITTEAYSALGKRKAEELFNGLFACAKCNYNLGNYVNISTEQVINRVASSEKYKFIVSNQYNIDNYNLLSYEHLDLIHNFYLNAGINFEITYSNNNIYFRFFTGNNLSPSIRSNSINVNILYKYYLIIKFIIEFIEKNKRV